MEVGTAELAEVLGITDRRIQTMEKQGVLHKAAHGKWDLADAVQRYIKFRIDGTKNRTKPAGSADEKLKQVKADREELKLLKERREVIPLSEAMFVVDVIAGTFALEMNNLAPRLSTDMDERDAIQKKIDEALDEVAATVRKQSESLRTGELPDEADEEDDA